MPTLIKRKGVAILISEPTSEKRTLSEIKKNTTYSKWSIFQEDIISFNVYVPDNKSSNSTKQR